MRFAILVKKAVALVACVALAALCVPVSALAADETSEQYFSLSSTQITLKAGEVFDLSSLVVQKESLLNTHFDYVTADSTVLTGSKHSNMIAANDVSAISTTTVTYYYLNGNQAEGIVGEPCEGLPILQQSTLTVTVDPVSAPTVTVPYGPQGDEFTIEMTEPAPVSATLSGDTYTNTLPDQYAGSLMKIVLKQSAGLNQYINYYDKYGFYTAENAYRGKASNWMTYVNAAGTSESIGSYGGVVGVTKVTSEQVELTIQLADIVGDASFIIRSGFHTYNGSDGDSVNKTLGYNLVFNFKVVPDDRPVAGPVSIEGAKVNLEYDTCAYDSSPKDPKVVSLTLADGTTVNTGYFYEYSNNVNAGTATVTVTGDTFNYSGTATANFEITKAANTIYTLGKTIKLKVNKKKKQTTNVNVYSPCGKVTYKSSKAKVKVNAKGKVTVAKAFKGKAVITATAAGDENHEKGSVKVTVNVA